MMYVVTNAQYSDTETLHLYKQAKDGQIQKLIKGGLCPGQVKQKGLC